MPECEMLAMIGGKAERVKVLQIITAPPGLYAIDPESEQTLIDPEKKVPRWKSVAQPGVVTAQAVVSLGEYAEVWPIVDGRLCERGTVYLRTLSTISADEDLLPVEIPGWDLDAEAICDATDERERQVSKARERFRKVAQGDSERQESR